ncbi:MAG: hypothetical protein KIT27_02135 [Legionellales bacterium]|nr:hypothetical protein [Legionellales bacterium]
MFLFRNVVILNLVFILSACSDMQVSTFPMADNTYRAVATSSVEADALQGATKKAEKTCRDQARSLQVISVVNKYQGAYDRQTQQTLTVVADAVRMATGKLTPSINSSNDYMTTMVFRCV